MDRSGWEWIEIETRDGLRELQSTWTEVVESDPRATIYQTWDWHDAWWKAFGRGKRLHIVVARKGGAVVAIAPLYISRHLGTPLRRLAFMGTGSFDYLDVICRPEEADVFPGLLLRRLQQNGGFDMADLQQIPPHAHMRCNSRSVDSLVTRAHWKEQDCCPFADISAGWNEFVFALGKKMRTNIGYYERLLFRTYEDAKIGLAGPDYRVEAMEALFRLHQKRWNARLLPGALGGEATQRFHLDISNRMQTHNILRLHTIKAEGRIVSVLYCFRYRERVYYYLGGFEPDLAKYSLGTVLTAAAMKHAADEGCAIFDFLRGDEDYKRRWTSLESRNARLLFGRPESVRSHAMLRLNKLENIIEHRAKRFASERGKGKKK